MRPHSRSQGGSVHRAQGGAQILQFKSRGSARPHRAPPIIHPLQQFDEKEDRSRMQQNMAAVVIIILLLATGFWLIDHLRASARITTCVEAGHSNCVPFDIDRSQPR
jgi:hypothetical protein